MEVNGGVGGPGRPSTSFAEDYARARIRHSEDDNIGVELLDFAAPRLGTVRRDGDIFAGEGDGGAVVGGSVRRKPGDHVFVTVMIFSNRRGVQSGPALERLIGALVSGDEVEVTVLEDWTVVEEAFGDGSERFGVGETWSGEVNPSGASSLRDENDVVGIIGEVAVEVDGEGVGEAAFGGGEVEREGEEVEAIGGPADGGEDDGASGLHLYFV